MKIETFKLNKDFRRLYGRGKNLVFPTVVVYYLKNRLNYCRIGITAGKKVGCAIFFAEKFAEIKNIPTFASRKRLICRCSSVGQST